MLVIHIFINKVTNYIFLPCFWWVLYTIQVNIIQIYMYRPSLTEPAAILPCCRDGEPYIGVDEFCSEDAVFCLQHSSHQGADGLMHQMMPLRQFKRTVNDKKFAMQEKVGELIENYNSFMDSLIAEIKQLKLRKSLELGMLWLRELASNEEEYELMKKVHRMDFTGLTCQKIHSIYYKIIHNQHLQKKTVYEMDCYKGMTAILEKLGDNPTAKAKICEKITDIEGLVEDGKILKKFLPDKRTINSKISQVILEESLGNNYNIRYHTAELNRASKSYLSLFTKYPLLSNTTYHLSIKTKYANLMIGICGQNVKQSHDQDLHYHKNSLVYNCSNGCIYSDGLFRSSAIKPIFKNAKEITVKIKLTNEEMIIYTKSQTLMREEFSQIKGKIYLHLLGRTKADYIEVERDKDLNEHNVQLEHTIRVEEESQHEEEYQECKQCEEHEEPEELEEIEEPEEQQYEEGSHFFSGHGTANDIQHVSSPNMEEMEEIGKIVPEISHEEEKPKEITTNDFLMRIANEAKGRVLKRGIQNDSKISEQLIGENQSSSSRVLGQSKIKPMDSIDENFYPTTMKERDVDPDSSQVRIQGLEERGSGSQEMHLTNYFSSLSGGKIRSDRSGQSGQEEKKIIPIDEASEINIEIPPSCKTNVNSEYNIGGKQQKKSVKLPQLNHYGFSKFSVQSSDVHEEDENIFEKNVNSYNIMKDPTKQPSNSQFKNDQSYKMIGSQFVIGKQEQGNQMELSKRESDSNFNSMKNDSTKFYFNSRGSQLMKVHISKIKQKEKSKEKALGKKW